MADDLVSKVIAARKAAEAAMPLDHGVQAGSEARTALILIAQVEAIMGGDVPDFSVAPEYAAPPEQSDSDDNSEAPDEPAGT